MAPPVMLTAWIDFLDPWSWVVVTRLARLSEDFGDQVELEWRSFVSYPSKQARDLDEWRRSTSGWMEPAAAEPGLRFSMWSTDNPPPTHSVPALAAALVAYDEDPVRAPDYCEALFRAHFTQNRTISDGRTLIEVAREAGLDEDGFAMRLRGRYAAYAKLAIDQHNEGARRQVTHAPAVMVGGEYLVRGPAEEKQYRDLIAQLLGIDPPSAAASVGSDDEPTDPGDLPTDPGGGAAHVDDGAARAHEDPVQTDDEAATSGDGSGHAARASTTSDQAPTAVVTGSPAVGTPPGRDAATDEPAPKTSAPAESSEPATESVPAKDPPAKDPPVKKAPAKKAPAKKAAAKKATAKKRRPAKKRAAAKKAAAGSTPASSTPGSGAAGGEEPAGSGSVGPDASS